MDLSRWALWLSWRWDPNGTCSDKFLCLKAPAIIWEVVRDGFLNYFSTGATCYTVSRSMSSASRQAGWWGSRLPPFLEWNRNRVNLSQQWGGGYVLRGSLDMLFLCIFFFLPPPFGYLLLSLSPCFWAAGTFGVWQRTAPCMGQTKVPCSVQESRFVASRKRKKTRFPGLFKLQEGRERSKTYRESHTWMLLSLVNWGNDCWSLEELQVPWCILWPLASCHHTAWLSRT